MSKHCKNCGEEKEDCDCDDGFVTSAIISAVTDSTILGAVIGGNLGGAILGDLLDGDLMD